MATTTLAPAHNHNAPASRVLIPVRYAAWLSGDLGKELQATLQAGLSHLPELEILRLPRGFLIQADEAPGPLLESVHRAVAELEEGVKAAYPVFHHEMGPVWTGTLQSVFTE